MLDEFLNKIDCPVPEERQDEIKTNKFKYFSEEEINELINAHGVNVQ